jgi:hypothetical protein
MSGTLTISDDELRSGYYGNDGEPTTLAEACRNFIQWHERKEANPAETFEIAEDITYTIEILR